MQRTVKRREAKRKGEKERYTHLNAEFQRIASGDKKAFLSDHGKEIEENNRLGNSRDLFKKIRDTKIAGRNINNLRLKKERHIHLNAKFQRRTRKDKKAFLSNQCNETGKQQK